MSEMERQIELWIAQRRFDLALPAVADLRGDLDAAKANAGNPESRRRLEEAGRNLRRLVRLAQAQRARMADELNKLRASAPYLDSAEPHSRWQVRA